MGLHATVYCDCLERDQLRVPPPRPDFVRASESGQREPSCADGYSYEAWIEFDTWSTIACEHPDGVLVEHRIGNIAWVAELRSILNDTAESFPILLDKFLYSGCHGGDLIPACELPALAIEARRLASIRPKNPEQQRILSHFAAILGDLVHEAVGAGRPIVF